MEQQKRKSTLVLTEGWMERVTESICKIKCSITCLERIHTSLTLRFLFVLLLTLIVCLQEGCDMS